MIKHCHNTLDIQFKDNVTREHFLKDLKQTKLYSDDDCNILQLAIPYDAKKGTIMLNGEEINLTEAEPLNQYWGSDKLYYYGCASENKMTPCYDFCLRLKFEFATAWSPVSALVIKELAKRYKVRSIKNHYWEDDLGFAGTTTCRNDHNTSVYSVSDSDHSYNIFPCKDTDFEKLVGYVDERGYTLSNSQLKALLKEIKNYNYFYTDFEPEAYLAFVDPNDQPLLGDLIERLFPRVHSNDLQQSLNDFAREHKLDWDISETVRYSKKGRLIIDLELLNDINVYDDKTCSALNIFNEIQKLTI